MENIVTTMDLFKGFKNKTVLITGHTGFKGSWLASWLHQLGAKVIGYSLPAQTQPAHINLLNLDIISIAGDIRDTKLLEEVFTQYSPQVVFHLAAQSLVLHSYQNPIETYDTNVMGTLKVLEAARKSNSTEVIINVTSDKCYENKEWPWGYREVDPMGGHDPYSSSKGCSELLTASYRNSFFPIEKYGVEHNTLLASVRAGNVIGGGDWAECRLIPDAIRATAQNSTLKIRSPKSIRPWQHVLEPLRGYLTLAEHLLQKKKDLASGWNFGPMDENCISVEEVLNKIKTHIPNLNYELEDNPFHEATFLKLDSSKAKNYLHFSPLLNIDQTLKMTAEWYHKYYSNSEILTNEQISWYMDFVSKA